METLTFDQLPAAVSNLTNKVEEIERLLRTALSLAEQPDQFLTIDEAAALLHLTKPTLYSKHSKGEIPGVCKQGKRLYFSRKELLDWVAEGRQRTTDELAAEEEERLAKATI